MEDKFGTLEKFCALAYEIAESKDELNMMILKEQLLRMIKQFNSNTILEFLYSHINHIYYLLINNKIYQKTNIASLKILLKEIRILYFLNKAIKNQEESEEKIMILIVKIFETLVKIDFNRISYVETNSNIGRTCIYDYPLTTISDLLVEEKNIEDQIKRALELQ